MKKFELSLSTDYVKHWKIWEAIRELWQNALDHNNYTYTWQFQELDNKPNILKIISKNVALETNCLLLGKTTKADDDDTIGIYGEGFKLALLVLIRMGKKVIIYNACCNEIWKPRIIKSRRYKAEILSVFVEKHIYDNMYNDDLTFEIEGITYDEWKEIASKNLHVNNRLSELEKIETHEGDILLNRELKPTAYVNGLYVSEIPVQGYRYSYNIKPKHIELDRDRGCIKGFDFKWLTSKMWANKFAHKKEMVIKMIENKIPDVAFIHHHINDKIIGEDIAKAFISKHGNKAVAVCSDDDFKAVKHEHGSHATPVIVNDSYKTILKKTNTYSDSVNNIPKRKEGISHKSPHTILTESCDKLCDFKTDECSLSNGKTYVNADKVKELVKREFNKLLGMSNKWRWK